MKVIQVADEKHCEVGEELCRHSWNNHNFCEEYGTHLRSDGDGNMLRCAACKKAGSTGVWEVWK